MNAPALPEEGLTDLSLVAKLGAAGAVSTRRLRDPIEHLAWVESGAPFEEAGIVGFLEAIPSQVEHVSGDEVAAALGSLQDEKDLGEIYMRRAPRRSRHRRGEYYTPAWLVDLVLDRGGYDGGSSLVDPMCGAGAFLTAALVRARRRNPRATASDLVRQIQGMDLNPLAVLMARASYLMALLDGCAAGLDRKTHGPIRIPVHSADAILSPLPRQFDMVAGNPPWVGWESLSAEYRETTRPLWLRHGLFPEGARGSAGRSSGRRMQAILGRGRKDLAMLATYAVAESMLKPGGRLGFVISQAVFKSVGSGAGFRCFVLADGTPLKVLSVDDLGSRTPFPGAASRAAVMTLMKGERTQYPIPYSIRSGDGVPRQGIAQPVDPLDPTSAWLTGPSDLVGSLRRVIGSSSYRARAGAYTGGANGVYWLRRLGDDGSVANIPGAGKRHVPQRRGRVEPDLLYPLLRAADIKRFHAAPSGWILIPQDPIRRRGIDERIMSERYPLALAWLERFRAELAARRDRGTRSLVEAGAPFYSIFSVSVETMATWKVVWPRIASRVNAAVVGLHEGKPVVPQETCTFIACETQEEACFLAGVLNSSLFGEAAASFTQVGGKSFGAPHLLRHVAVPRYDPARASHSRLAALVRDLGPALSIRDLDAAAAAAGWPPEPGGSAKSA